MVQQSASDDDAYGQDGDDEGKDKEVDGDDALWAKGGGPKFFLRLV